MQSNPSEDKLTEIYTPEGEKTLKQFFFNLYSVSLIYWPVEKSWQDKMHLKIDYPGNRYILYHYPSLQAIGYRLSSNQVLSKDPELAKRSLGLV